MLLTHVDLIEKLLNYNTEEGGAELGKEGEESASPARRGAIKRSAVDDKSNIARSVADMLRKTMRKMDNNGNGVLSGAEWDAGLGATGWVEYYNENYGPDVSVAEHKSLSKSIFIALSDGQGLLSFKQFWQNCTKTMLAIGQRAELARTKGIALKKKEGGPKMEKDLSGQFKKTYVARTTDQNEILKDEQFIDPMQMKSAPTEVGGGNMDLNWMMMMPSRAKSKSDKSDSKDGPEADSPASKSSPRKEGVQLAIPSETMQHVRPGSERRSPRAVEVLQTIETALRPRGPWKLSDFRQDFVRITVFPNGDRHHKGSEVYINKKLPWADVLQQAARDARPLAGPVAALYDTNLQPVRSSVDALVDGATYLACSGERPNAWPLKFPTTRSAPKLRPSPARPAADPLSTTSTVAQLLRLQAKQEVLSSELNKKILERARKVREANRLDDFYGTFTEKLKAENRSRSQPNLR